MESQLLCCKQISTNTILLYTLLLSIAGVDPSSRRQQYLKNNSYRKMIFIPQLETPSQNISSGKKLVQTGFNG